MPDERGDENECSILGMCSWNGTHCSYVLCKDMPRPELCTDSQRCQAIEGKPCEPICPPDLTSQNSCNSLYSISGCVFDYTMPSGQKCKQLKCVLAETSEDCEKVGYCDWTDDKKCVEKKCSDLGKVICSEMFKYKCTVDGENCRDKTCAEYTDYPTGCQSKEGCIYDKVERICRVKACKDGCEYCSKNECKSTPGLNCIINKDGICKTNPCTVPHMEGETESECECIAPYKKYSINNEAKCLKPLKMNVLLKSDDL